MLLFQFLEMNTRDQYHCIENCTSPINFDGSGHSNTCKYQAKKTNFRTDVYGQMPMTMFEICTSNPKDELHFLKMVDDKTGVFEKLQNGGNIHAHDVNGVFNVFTRNEKSYIRFDATSITRFSVAIAYFVDGIFRLRCRLLTTHDEGLLCFPLFTTFKNENGVYQLPPEFQTQKTVLVIGIATLDNESTVDLRIHANKFGKIDDSFNGYFGTSTIQINSFQ